MTFESHLSSALNVQDDAVPFVGRGHDWFCADAGGQLEKVLPVELVEPGEVLAHLGRVYPAARDVLDVLCLARQHRRRREFPAIGLGGGGHDVTLPALGELIADVELCPVETQRLEDAVRAKPDSYTPPCLTRS